MAVPGPLRHSTRASRPPKPADESMNFTNVLRSEPLPSDVLAPDNQTQMEAVSGGDSGEMFFLGVRVSVLLISQS